mgnify:CR=1 FL=1
MEYRQLGSVGWSLTKEQMAKLNVERNPFLV